MMLRHTHTHTHNEHISEEGMNEREERSWSREEELLWHNKAVAVKKNVSNRHSGSLSFLEWLATAQASLWGEVASNEHLVRPT